MQRNIEDDLNIIANNISRLRQEKEWNQQTLAYHADTRQGTISQLEQKHNRNPTLNLLRKIASALGVKVIDLIQDPQRTIENRQTKREFPPALATFISEQNRFLGEKENDLTMEEIDALKALDERATPEDYLSFLRKIREANMLIAYKNQTK